MGDDVNTTTAEFSSNENEANFFLNDKSFLYEITVTGVNKILKTHVKIR